MSPAVIIVVVVCFAAVVVLRQRVQAGFVDPAQARRLVEDGAALLDVRTPQEFEAGHIEGARNIPLDEITGRAQDVGPKDAPIVVYCRSGMRSAQAKAKLEAAGFSQVHNLGGMSRW